ncbi:MAG: hypothetical protein IPL61_12015 [Myxococcales bacterium]|nr:hypothetical protein [Myxococcales bacterium]
MVAAAGRQLDGRLELIDGVGLLPLRAHGRAFATAAAFRWHWQKVLGAHLGQRAEPAARWRARPPRSGRRDPRRDPAGAGPRPPRRCSPAPASIALPIDHAVGPVDDRGGAPAAAAVLRSFVATRLPRYADARNQPEVAAASGLSPYLHFGHMGAHTIVDAVWRGAGSSPAALAGHRATGSRDGWWGLPRAAEAFMDELFTWRELGYGFCHHRADYDRYESLPPWAGPRSTPTPAIRARTATPRAELERAAAHDRSGTRPSASSSPRAASTTTCACSGARKILEW